MWSTPTSGRPDRCSNGGIVRWTSWPRSGSARRRAFEEGLRLLGYEIGSHYVGDLLQHMADVRHALGLGMIADDEALAVGLDFYLIVFDRELTSSPIPC
jgi:hypothetical protein